MKGEGNLMVDDQNVDEFALDPAAFAEDAPPLDFFDPVVAAQLRAKLLKNAERCAIYWGEIRRRSMELACQIYVL